MVTRSAGRFAAVAALCTGTLLLGACADNQGSAVPAAASSQPESPQERNLRVRDELVRLGCDTNSCIQTYFACEDGLLSGEACEFYRAHPLD
ncbi:hypothetical protein [Nocardia testacea]|uniref:hypothetical protein n=1 Tax=Nocardia testacea TaxID=248551 RepID=UPI0012F6BA42|nr:hypothetical protein [Nocardia testacea]